MSFLHDLRYAFRTLRSRPAFTVLGVLTLGLGIATITGIFSLSNAFFLRPLDFPQPERLVHVWQTDSAIDWDMARMSVPNYDDLRAQTETFEGVGGYYYTTFTLGFGVGESNEQVQATLMTPSLLTVLGVFPIHGRGFLQEDAEAGKNKVVLLSHSLWQRKLGGDPDAVGSTLVLDEEVYTVVGVMPASFVFPFNSMDLWAPLVTDRFTDRGTNGPLLVVGRLRAGQTLEDGQIELQTVMSRLESQYPDTNTGRGVNVVPLRSQLLFTWDIFRAVFPALFLAVGFVLLIVCANLGNLLLARGAERSREIAFRLTLGANRWRLVRQLVTESAVLALFGGTLGVLLAHVVAQGFEQNMPGELYRVGAIAVDGTALLFALAVSLLSAMAFGLAPALQITNPNLAAAVKEGGRSAAGGPGQRRLRVALVVTQVALAVLLVAGASLMVKTFVALQNVQLGFDAERLLTLEVTLPNNKYEGEERNRYFEEALERVRAIPGVERAAAIYPLPLNHESLGGEIEIEGWEPTSPDEVLSANTFWMTTDSFATLGIPLLRGRTFTPQDNSDTKPVVVVNRRLAERYFPGGEALGGRVRIRDEWRAIVGVVADSVTFALNEEVQPVVYYPQLQETTRRRFFMVRSEGDPLQLTKPVLAELAAIDPDQPVTNERSMRQVINTWMAPWMMGIGGLSGLGIGALLLASMGLYGVVSYGVARRTGEFGIRNALGAQRRDIFRLVLSQGVAMTALGMVIGLAGAAALTRFLQSLLFGVGSLDPVSFVMTPLLLLVVALAASYFPALRAVRVDPAIALRSE